MRIYPFFLPHGGCGHRCLFCCQRATSGQSRMPTVAAVRDALDAILPGSGDGEVAFFGGSFTLLPVEVQEQFLGVVGPFLRAGRVSGIRLSTRPDGLSAGCVDRLCRAGVSTVEIGCQSFSDAVLRLSGRGHGPEEAGQSVRRLRSAGIAVGLQLMPGLPGGDRDEALYSLSRALELAPDFLRIYPTVILRGTALEQLWQAGRFEPLTLDQAVELCADLLRRCHQARVPVIRMGLQASPELDSGNVLAAGPYHPAFGQLVRSRLWRRALDRVSLAGKREVAVHPADLADAIGHRRENLLHLQVRHNDFTLMPSPEVLRGRIAFGPTCSEMMELAGE